MARWYSDEQLEDMDAGDAVSEIGNAVYEAAHLFERLEGKGKVRGNGHHIMQDVAEYARKLMRERWVSD